MTPINRMWSSRSVATAEARELALRNGAPVGVVYLDGWYAACEDPEPGGGWETVAVIDPGTWTLDGAPVDIADVVRGWGIASIDAVVGVSVGGTVVYGEPERTLRREG